MTSKIFGRLGEAPEEGVKAPVVVATIANEPLTALPVISTVQLVAGDRVLAKSQTDKSENGIYIAAAGAWKRATDWNKQNDVIEGQLVVDANSGILYRTSFNGTFEINVTETDFFKADLDSTSKDRATLDIARSDDTIKQGDVVRVKEISASDGGTTMIFDVIAFVTEDIPNGIYTHTADTGNSFVMRDRDQLEDKTLAAALARTDIKIDSLFNVTERQTDSGGGAIWKVIAKGTTAEVDLPNGFYITASTGITSLALFLLGEEFTPEMFGANLQLGTDQTPFMQALEDWGKLNNKPTYYSANLYEMQTKLVITRAPHMYGTGGGQGTIRSSIQTPVKIINGTIFYSKVAGDFCVSVENPAFDYGGHIENITTIGKRLSTDTKIVGHGWFMNDFGWSSQINNLSIEGFTGKGLNIKYLQDVIFNSLTILDCSNGPLEPGLEWSNVANFVFFNDIHLEECDYLMRVRDATTPPWGITFHNGHFETGNYFDGAAASAPDPALERRYTSPPIFGNETIRQWTFDNCFFVPAGVGALDADNPIGVDNQPYYIQFNECSGFKFNNCRFQAATGGCDTIRLETTDLFSNYGPNVITGLEVVNANPTKFGLKTNGTYITSLTYHFNQALSSSRLYGIEVDNGQLDNLTFVSDGAAITRTEGFLVSALLNAKTLLGSVSYNLESPAFNYVSKKVSLTGYGFNELTITATQAIDLQRHPHDTQIVANSASPITISDITNFCFGKKLTIINRAAGNVSLTSTATFKPTTSIFGQEIAVEFISDGSILRQIS